MMKFYSITRIANTSLSPQLCTVTLSTKSFKECILGCIDEVLKNLNSFLEFASDDEEAQSLQKDIDDYSTIRKRWDSWDGVSAEMMPQPKFEVSGGEDSLQVSIAPSRSQVVSHSFQETIELRKTKKYQFHNIVERYSRERDIDRGLLFLIDAANGEHFYVSKREWTLENNLEMQIHVPY